MQDIHIPEASIEGVRPLKHGGTSITLHIKREDLSEEDNKKCLEIWRNTESVSLLMRPEQEKIETPKKKNPRSELAFVMQQYCEKSGEDVEQAKQAIYTKHNITSRSQLDDETCNMLIESYRAGLLEY